MNCSQARDEYKNSEILFTGKVVSTEVSIMSLYLISAPSNINQDIFKDKQRETENFSSSVDDTVTKGFGSRRSISLTENKRKKISRKNSLDIEKDNIAGVNITQKGRNPNSTKTGTGLRGAEIKRQDENLIVDNFESKKLDNETSEDSPPLLPRYDKRRAKYRREKIFRLHKNPTRFSFDILRQRTGVSPFFQSR